MGLGCGGYLCFVCLMMHLTHFCHCLLVSNVSSEKILISVIQMDLRLITQQVATVPLGLTLPVLIFLIMFFFFVFFFLCWHYY